MFLNEILIFVNEILIFLNEILFRRFGDRYDEFGDDSFMKSYQEKAISLMVKFEDDWRTVGRLNDDTRWFR